MYCLKFVFFYIILAFAAGCAHPPVESPDTGALLPGNGFIDLPDGSRIFERTWIPEKEAEAVVVLLHGSGSHSGGLDHLAQHLRERGFAVYAFDYPGFGYSPGDRAITPPFDTLQDLLSRYLETVRERQLDKPLFLVGESMGGTLAVYMDIHGGLDVDGVILCGAAFDYPPGANAFLRSIARFIGFFGDSIPLVPADPEEVTRSQDAIERFRADPLMVHGRIPVGHVNRLMRTINSMRPYLDDVNVPFFIQHGSEDHVAPLGAAEELFRRAASQEKKLTVYPGVMHAILHEPEWPRVADDMADWMLAFSGG